MAGYLGSLATIGFWPAPVDKPIHGALTAMMTHLHRHGLPDLIGYNFVEASANVLVFIPLGLFAASALPAKTWWQVAAVGALMSVAMELGQLLFLTDRFCSLSDVVTNTVGGVIGITVSRMAPWRIADARKNTKAHNRRNPL